MKSAKLNISKKFLPQEEVSQFDSLIPENITTLSVADIEVVSKYGDSCEISLVVNLANSASKRYLSFLTSKKEIVQSLAKNTFEHLSLEMKIDIITMILKTNKQYLTQSIFNN